MYFPEFKPDLALLAAVVFAPVMAFGAFILYVIAKEVGIAVLGGESGVQNVRVGAIQGTALACAAVFASAAADQFVEGRQGGVVLVVTTLLLGIVAGWQARWLPVSRVATFAIVAFCGYGAINF